MALAKKKIQPPPVDGLLPVPDEIAHANERIGDIDLRLRNMNTGMAEAANTLTGHREELETLDDDEREKLMGLGEAEAEERDNRPFRDALDSIRARRMLLTSKVENLEADQAGRRESIAKLTDELADIQASRERQINEWRYACYQANEERLTAKVQEAVGEMFDWMVAAGNALPRPDWFNNWSRVNLLGRYDFLKRGQDLRSEINEHARRNRHV